MAAPLDIQDGAGPEEVFHTPPEESLLPYSDEQRPPLALDADLCVANHAVEVDSGIQGFAEFVDFGKDSDLGFSEDYVVDAETIAEYEGDGPSEGSERSVDEIRVPKRELSGPGESSVKKLKLSEQDLGFGSSGDLPEAESQKAEVGAGNCDSGTNLEHQENVLEPQDLGSGENLENQVGQTEVKEDAGAAVSTSEAGKLPKSSDEVIEASGTKERIGDEPKGRVLPTSFRVFVDDAAKVLKSEEGVKKERAFTFEVLKFLAEQHDKDDDDLENPSWLEVLTHCGVAFPCPRWWPENYVELNYNALGLLLERD